ncbi:MAG: amino acid permease [Actinomycetaceae bacterium]|nr:amino acid permease [Actinomycetaceae bacterium]
MGCALIGAAAIMAVLVWALVSEALGGIDIATRRLEPWAALEAARLNSFHIDSFIEAFLGAMFPAAVLALMHERVLVAPKLRRVPVQVLRRIFGFLIFVIIITLYFVGVLQIPSYHLSVVTLSMAYGFWGTPGEIIVGICYIVAGMAGVLTAYSHLPRLLRALAMDRFLPRRMADVGASGSRLGVVIAVALLASILATVLTTTQAGAMVFIFLAFTILGIVCAAMARRMSALAREAVIKDDRQQMRYATWTYRVVVIFDAFVLICIAYLNWAWALAGILSLAVPASFLIFFRREKLKVRRSLEVDNLAESHALPTRIHGLIYVAGVLDASVVKAVSYARGMRLSSLTAITVDYDLESTRALREDWKTSAMPVSLTVLGSPRKASHDNVVDYVRNLRSLHSNDTVVVFMPRVVTTGLLRSLFVRHSTKKMLSELRKEDGVVLAEVPYVLPEGD